MEVVCKPARWMLLIALVVSGLSWAQDSDEATVQNYRSAWRGGNYAEAVRLIDLLVAEYEHFVPLSLSEDQAAIYEDVGRIDEAITIYETMVRRYGELYHRVALIELLEYRGRVDEAERMRGESIAYALRSGGRGFTEENWLAFTRLAEMEGENPKEILNSRMKSLLNQRPDYVPAHLLAGDVAYRNYGYGQAAKYYLDALNLEPDNTDALLGLARCYAASNDPSLEGTLKQMLEVNPHHPGGTLLRAEALLDEGKTTEAIALCDAVLSINPVHLEAMALKAAALFVAEDLAGVAALQATSRAFNPVNSQLEYRVGLQASQKYRFSEGADWQGKALEIDGGNKQARTQLGLDLLRLGQNDTGQAILDEAFAEDPYNVQVFNMLEVLDSLEQFQKITSPTFEIYLPEKEALLFGRDMERLLNEALARYEATYDVDLEKPISVQMFDDHDEFMVRSVGLPGNPGHLGICFGQLVTMDSPRARPPGAMNWESVLWHEFVHCITLQKTRNRMDRWLSEGISVFEETRRNPAWGQPMELDFRGLIDLKNLPALTDLDGFFRNPKTPGHLMLGYFYAGAFTAWYVENFGQETLNGALDAIGQGAKTDGALLEATGLAADAFDEQWQAYLYNRCAALENLPARVEVEDPSVLFEQAPWQEHPSAFTDALSEARAAIAAEDLERAATLLRTAHGLYPEYRAADSPLYILAGLYRDHGRTAEWKAVLEEAVHWDHLALKAARDLMALQVDAAEWEAVLETTGLARAIDPLNLEIIDIRKDALRNLNQHAEALALVEVLITASPADTLGYRLERVGLLRAQGQHREAKQAVVRLLEEYPHYGAAQDVLLELVDATS